MLPNQIVAPARASEIADLAEAVAGEHSPRLPVDPAGIAQTKRITISFGDYGQHTFDGLLEHLDGYFHIYCNTQRVGNRESPRARFTLAHELGHFFIDEHRRSLAAGIDPHSSLCEYESPILAEQEADTFAANLLMPARRFTDAARAAMPGLEGILALAGRFGTSITATAIRYAGADVRPCVVIKWDWHGYAWKRASASAFAAYLRRTYQAARDIPADCPTLKALARQTPPECGYFHAGTTAAAWFPRIHSGEWRDVIFIEQAIPLGRYGVLTLLCPQSGI